MNDQETSNPELAVDDSLGEMLFGRSAFYNMLAGLFYQPLKQEQIDNIAEMDYSMFDGASSEISEGFDDIRRYLRKAHGGTREELAVDFTGSFGGISTFEGKTASPYASLFTDDSGLIYRKAWEEVFRAYKKNGVRLREDLDLPEDHLSFLCQFMGFLADRAYHEAQAGDMAQLRSTLETSLSFLDTHILPWYPAFSDVASALIETRFYRGVLKIAHGYFVFDRTLLSESLEGLQS